MFNLTKLFDKNNPVSNTLSKAQIAELLKTTPGALEAFEASYQSCILAEPDQTGNLFGTSAKQAVEMREAAYTEATQNAQILETRIIAELLDQTDYMDWDGQSFMQGRLDSERDDRTPVTIEEVMAVPEKIRPQLTGRLMKKDVPGDTAATLLWSYQRYQNAATKDQKKEAYQMFRWGLDSLDLDPLTYEILGLNKNNMSQWLPALCNAVKDQDFFKVPKTRVIKVPLPLLQLSRLDYGELTPGTMEIVDRFAYRAFNLNENQDYFIKTGIFSSKFDFRNAKVTGAKEVHELGEYLLFISNQAVMMASPLMSHRSYGAATTNEWVVREFIHDPENNPTIYKGLPLRTEYRLFIDADTCAVIGENPYWDPAIMKARFGDAPDANDPHNVHDFMTYYAAEETLMAKYNENIQKLKARLETMIPAMRDAGLNGQWSVDIMQSGKDFYIIDMALAENSAYYDCVPQALRSPTAENWLPQIPPAE